MTGNGHPIWIPRWAIAAVLAVLAVFGAGYALSQKVGTQVARVDAIDARLCRIETALHIPPWPSCTTRERDRQP